MTNESTGTHSTVWVASACCLLVLLATAAAGRGAEKLDFCLRDALGREVRSQDYEGATILLEFGACW